MIKYILILCALASGVFGAVTIGGKASLNGKASLATEASGGGGGFSDDFNRADGDSLGGNWTEIGDVDIASNAANSPQTFDNNLRGAAYTATSCGSVNQYVKVTLTSNNSGGNVAPGVLLRYTDASSPCYNVRFAIASDIARWNRLATPTPTGTDAAVDNDQLTVAPGDVVGITIGGTGASTVVRIWVNPTGLPSAVDNWDGDTTPSLSLTVDPGTPVDTGNYVGICGLGSLGVLEWDDFYGGGLP